MLRYIIIGSNDKLERVWNALKPYLHSAVSYDHSPMILVYCGFDGWSMSGQSKKWLIQWRDGRRQYNGGDDVEINLEAFIFDKESHK